MKPRRIHPVRRTMEYKAASRVCAACALRPQCTRAKLGRTVKRHEKQAALDIARGQAQSRSAGRDRTRRQQLMEGSFADASNNHHFKRARWRRLWRQQIQDYLIAAIQNVRILLAQNPGKRSAAMTVLPPQPPRFLGSFSSSKHLQCGRSSTEAISLPYAIPNLPDRPIRNDSRSTYINCLWATRPIHLTFRSAGDANTTNR